MQAGKLTSLRPKTFGAVLTVAVMVSACAGAPGEKPPSLINDQGQVPPAPASYVLTPQELGYSCKKLTGTMQIRLLQVRQYDPKENPTYAARGVQSVATPIFGGTTVGIDPEGQHRRDLAMLEAYNRRLAEKNCKTLDLAAELKKQDPAAVPNPY